MRPMTTWHRLGDKPELFLQVPTVFKLDRWSVAVFHHDGRFRAIGNACNHKGGPLSEGRLHGEFVMCPWHAWEYSVITGKGPEGDRKSTRLNSSHRTISYAVFCLKKKKKKKKKKHRQDTTSETMFQQR